MVLEHPTHMQRFPFVSFDEKPAPAVIVEPPVQAPVAAPAEQLPLPEPVFSEKDLLAARAEGHARGHREGFAAAVAKFDKETAARDEAVRNVLEVIANRVTLAAEAQAQAAKQQQGLYGRIILVVARKLAGDALKRDPYAAVQSLLRECMAMIAGQPGIVIAASPLLCNGLRQRLDLLRPILQGFDGDIQIVDDDSLFDQDCRVEWKNGHGEHDATALWSKIEEMIHAAAFGAKDG